MLVGPPEATRFCAEAGVRSIEHGVFSNQQSINAMKEKETYLVPTLALCHLFAQETAWPTVTREVGGKAVAALAKTLRMAKKAGIKVAMGTRFCWPIHWAPTSEK